jgi:hypothetical protein
VPVSSSTEQGRRVCWRGDLATGQVYAARGNAASVGAGEFFTEFAESALRDLTERDVDLAIEQGVKANIQPRAMTTVVQAATALDPASAL